MIRCYITDRKTCKGDLLDNIERVARDGVNCIQLRENDLTGRDLLQLTEQALARIVNTPTKLLVNDRADIAIAAGAHGVHLKSTPIPPAVYRQLLPEHFMLSVSCHNLGEIQEAEGADVILYSPIFASPGKGQPIGLDALKQATGITSIPILALGGITNENAVSCLSAGASGIAAIRLFQP
ncbi:MAG: thiamine phosphate synthase [Bryobacteraceae bacterium]|nr:thiamine phosphate synthase [Bryobacteraceae bacterium]